MQYCAAAPVAKLVPYSESLLSRCGNDSYRYCELYLSMAHPGPPADEVDGIAMPAGCSYAANHMWLEVGEDGKCHAGIDAFLSRALGKVERIRYVWQQGLHRPAAILTAGGADWEVVFPNPLLLTGCNLYLRANPAPPQRRTVHGGMAVRGERGRRHHRQPDARRGGQGVDGAGRAPHPRSVQRAGSGPWPPTAGCSPWAC